MGKQPDAPASTDLPVIGDWSLVIELPTGPLRDSSEEILPRIPGAPLPFTNHSPGIT